LVPAAHARLLALRFVSFRNLNPAETGFFPLGERGLSRWNANAAIHRARPPLNRAPSRPRTKYASYFAGDIKPAW